MKTHLLHTYLDEKEEEVVLKLLHKVMDLQNEGRIMTGFTTDKNTENGKIKLTVKFREVTR